MLTTRRQPHDFDGASYARASTHQKEWGVRLIAELGLTGSERVLDLGCGDGALSARIAGLVPDGEVVGVDASPGMIAAATADPRPNLRFKLMDIDDIDQLGLGGRFDVVYSNAALHWVKDHRRLYRRVDGLLGACGRIRFSFAGAGNCSHFFALVREVMQRDEFAAAFADFQWPWYMPSVEEYGRLVRTCGVPNARVWGENADRRFPDVETMVAWVDQPSLVPFVTALPKGLESRFRDLVVARMIDETRQPDGSCFETFRRIHLSAQR
jgi:trans-aconitate 2-methyltransferase